MLDYQLAKAIHEDRLREAERKRLRSEIKRERDRQKANAAPSAGRRLLLHLAALLLLVRRGS